MNRLNKFFERLGVAFLVLLCVFSSWIFITQSWGDLGEGGDGPRPGIVYYFTNSVDSSPLEIGNYSYDDKQAEPAQELPDLSIDQLIVMDGATYDGNATFNSEGYNSGTVTGDAVFVGDLSENLGVVDGTITRRYIASLTTSRDFTQNGPWIVEAADGAEVDITGATYDNSVYFIRTNGGSFVSDFSITSAIANERTVTLTFNETLNSNSVPSVNNFNVKVDGEEPPIQNIAISGMTLVITMESRIPNGAASSVSYVLGENVLSNSQGINVVPFDSYIVTVETQPSLGTGRYSTKQVVPEVSSPLTFLDYPDTKDGDVVEKEYTAEKNGSGESFSSNVVTQEVVSTESSPVILINEELKTEEIIINQSPVEPDKNLVEEVVETKVDQEVITPGPTAEKLKSKLLLAVEDRGKVWYVSPNDAVRYEVNTNNSLNLFRKVSLGITNNDLAKIPESNSSAPITPIAQRLIGRFLLQVENRGQTWFVDQLGYKHKVTSENILEVTSKEVLGIDNEKLEEIPLAENAQ
ncbi:hypothetical protein IPN41_00180 [Candidatus Falkowbacteria bacterium]|nr:MAG: hypothetical protein IPN41_00180 [Candidatus Falkowbacteria bacterium]